MRKFNEHGYLWWRSLLVSLCRGGARRPRPSRLSSAGASRDLSTAAGSCTCAPFWCCCGGRAERITGFCLRNGLKVKLKLAVTARSWHLAASLNSNITRLGRPRRAASADALAKRPKSAPVSGHATCAICFDPTTVTLVCGHAMCEECMGRLAVFQGQTLTRSRRRVVIQCPLRCDASTERVLA